MYNKGIEEDKSLNFHKVSLTSPETYEAKASFPKSTTFPHSPLKEP